MSIAIRLRRARERAGLTRRDVDRAIGAADSGHTGKIERGERKRLQYETVQALARALGVTVEWLMGTGERRAS